MGILLENLLGQCGKPSEPLVHAADAGRQPGPCLRRNGYHGLARAGRSWGGTASPSRVCYGRPVPSRLKALDLSVLPRGPAVRSG